METFNHFAGIDVQKARGCACAVINSDGESVGTDWSRDIHEMPARIESIVRKDSGSLKSLAVGIDSPQFLLKKPRKYFWDGKRCQWRNRRSGDVGQGRHCEVVISAHRLANPQWTPVHGREPEWMAVGIRVYNVFSSAGAVYEVFPTASYALFEPGTEKVQISLAAFRQGPKDMLDAYVAAVTVRDFVLGHGVEVGGGDGLGTIILPKPIPNPIKGVLEWPESTRTKALRF